MSAHQGTFLEDAVLENLLLQTDPVSQQMVRTYMDLIKNTHNSWQLFMDSLMKGFVHNNFKFFCLQIIENYIRHSYCNAPQEHLMKMKLFLSSWINLQCLPTAPSDAPPVYIKNKSAQIFALVFVQDFPHRWPSYFVDLKHTLNLGLPAVDHFIRVLLAIDSEILDQRTDCSTTAELQRNKVLKYAIRETAIYTIVESWYEILCYYQGRNADIVCQCLAVITKYVSWININVIANDRFVQLLLQLLVLVDVRESVVDCFYSMIIKGMQPMEKYNLIEYLFHLLEHKLMRLEDHHETSYYIKISNLVNGIGLNLISTSRDLYQIGTPKQLDGMFCAIEQKIPLLIKFLGNSCNDISMGVVAFAREYIRLLKTRSNTTEEQLTNVKSILTTVMQKMKYKYNKFNISSEDDDMSFSDYRSHLQTLFSDLVNLDCAIVYSFTELYITDVLLNWRMARFEDTEIAISLIYLIGQAIPPSIICGEFICNAADLAEKPPMQRMMCKLVTSEVSSHPHSIVKLQYLKTAVLYNKFFAIESQYLVELIKIFLREDGLRSSDWKFSSCVASLFLTLIKSLEQHMSCYALDILVQLSDMLMLSTLKEEHQVIEHHKNKQLYLYEAAALLICSSLQTAQEKGELFFKLINPNLVTFRKAIAQLGLLLGQSLEKKTNKDGDVHLSYIIAVTTHASKAFRNNESVESCSSVEIFEDALKTFLTCSQLPLSKELQAAIRKFVYRMIVCLENRILPHMPHVAQVLLQNGDVVSIQEYLAITAQIVSKLTVFLEFEAEQLAFIQKILMPIVDITITALATPIDENAEARIEKQQLQTDYFRLVKAIVGSNLVTVFLVHESNFLKQLILSTVQGAIHLPDPISQRTCFSTLRQLVTLCCTNDEPTGFTNFIYQYIVPACFQVPMNPTFDLTDGYGRLVLVESAKCMKAIHGKKGLEFIKYLKLEYLPTLSFPFAVIEEYCQALLTDNKAFTSYVKIFFDKARNGRF